MTFGYKATAALAAACALVAVGAGLPSRAAAASPRPTVTRLSALHDATWGGLAVTITGTNLAGVRRVTFGSASAQVLSASGATTLVVADPGGRAGTVNVRVTTAAGVSPVTAADRFTYRPPTMGSPINGGWTAYQEQSIDRSFMARAGALSSVPVAPGSSAWTLAMGQSAARRARAWVGLPYSWAGGSTGGPTYGSCYSGDGGGGEFDCRVWGFDCSGLALYGWGRYLSLPHYAASQSAVAGAFRPSPAELEPGDLLFYAGGQASGIGHVVMYIGGGQVVQAYESGHPVMISPVTGMVAMAGRYFGAVRPRSTGRQGTAPTVTGVSAAAGRSAGGDLLTVTGRGFSSATSVVFGGTVVYAFQVLSPSRIRVRVPAHTPGTVDVRVAGAWGTSTATARDRYGYVGLPVVTGATGPAGATGRTAGGDRVTVTGVNFSRVTAVTFAGARGTGVQVVSPTRLTVTTPPHEAGAVAVTVSTAYGVTRPPHVGRFTFVAPPTVALVSPASGPQAGGTRVTVSGASFTGVLQVLFGDVPGTGVRVSSTGTLSALTPPGQPGMVAVTVVTRYGSSAPAGGFTYQPAGPGN